MRKLFKSFKTEINPTVEQKVKINKTIGTCRYVYNFYLSYNKTLHDKGEKFMTGKKFPEFKAGDTITVAYKIVTKWP